LRKKLMENKYQFNDLIESNISNVTSDCPITSFRPWMELSDVMSRDVATISKDETVGRAGKIMAENNISCVIVVDNETVTGVLTETDILKRAVAKKKNFNETKVREVMSSPVQSAPPHLSVFDAAKITQAQCIKRLPILQEKRLVGIVTQTDLTRVLTSCGMWRGTLPSPRRRKLWQPTISLVS
jgi:CBS domain-containing protein